MRLETRKKVAVFELVLIMTSLFAFSLVLRDSGTGFYGTSIESKNWDVKHLLDFFDIIPSVSAATAVSEPTVCCEQTIEGAFCVNTQASNCAPGSKAAPTSCETTSYCKQGTCYDSDEGICMSNTPQNVCEGEGGTWDPRELAEVPQCQLGCCIIADQAAFVPLVRCKKLSTFFGVENNYRTDITSEVQCIAEAQGQDKGACVFEKDFERVCEFTTRAECGAGNSVETVNGTDVVLAGEKKFYKDLLCSAEELNTACARQTTTTCYQGDVYWQDSCGNLENVYSANRDKSWNKGRVEDPDGVCSAHDGSDPDCGNCDYLQGTRCSEYEGILGTGLGKPEGSDYFCKRTECVDRNGETRINGESWCVNDGRVGEGRDPVGSRYFREVCVDGDVRVEPCADFRNEVCLQGSIETDSGDFSTAACRVNRWQDCTAQDEEDDCTNLDRRDCLWLNPITGLVLGTGASGGSERTTGFSNPTANSESFGNPTATGQAVAPITGNALFGGGDDEEIERTETNREEGVCVPNFPPGLNFWKESSATGICSFSNARCAVIYEKGLLSGGWECVDNCECLTEDWALSVNQVCNALGDCGGSINYEGTYHDDGYEWKIDNKSKEFSPNAVNNIKAGYTFSFLALIMNFVGPILVAAGGAVPSAAPAPTAGGSFVAGSDTFVTASGDLIPGTTFAGPGGVAPGATAPTASGATGTSWISSTLGLEKGLFADAAFTGLQWAVVAYFAGQAIGAVLGLSANNTQALSTALAVGFGTYGALTTYTFTGTGSVLGAQGILATYPGYIAAGIGVVIFVAMYKDTKVEVVTFNCLPWQAPTGGGNNCELCNDDTLPCSEYRCRSLGQTCELVNKGTADETCVDINPRDVSPPIIRPDETELTDGYVYTNIRNSPPSPGFEIVKQGSDNGCLEAFTPLKFGIETDEPSQCKIDFESTVAFEEMRNFMGGSNLFAYNHTEQFSLPGAAALANASLILQNGNDLELYIRCQDKAGNENSAEYAVSLCIDPSPDTTAPELKATSILNGGCVAEDQESATVEFYTNEPATCKWSFVDEDYDLMDNEMACSNQLYQVNSNQLFTCRTDLTGIPRDGVDYYIRCKDQPGAPEEDRNENAEAFVFSLTGSTGLRMKNLRPNSTIFGGVSPAPVELYAETLFGCNDGQAICYYSPTGEDDSYIAFFDTNNEDGIHTQRLDLPAGDYDYSIQCIDGGGNVATDTASFTLDIDTSAPVIARIYEEENLLKVVTVRDSECSYTLDTCDFSFDEGTPMPTANTTIHVAEWNKDLTYHIKCRDEFRNEDAQCSAIVKPSDNFFF